MISFEKTHPLCIILYFLCGISFFCNIIGLIKMFKIERKMRFEKYVLISGIIEISLTILFISKVHKEILQDIVQSLQTFITLYISKQFLALYITMEHSLNKEKKDNDNDNDDNEDDNENNKQYGKHIYNTYFWILTFIIIMFLITIFLIDILIDDENNIWDDILDFINDLIYSIISIILFIFSLMVRKILAIKNNEIINDKDIENEIYLKNEKYLTTRKIQILIIALGSGITDIIEFILSLFKEIIFSKEMRDYDNNNNQINIFDLLLFYSLWIDTFMNFIAFYFVVRDSFHINYVHIKKRNASSSNILITKTLIEKDFSKLNNKDIENFLLEDNNDNKNKKENFLNDNDFNE